MSDESGGLTRMLLRPTILALACLTTFAGFSSASAPAGARPVRHAAECNSHRSHALMMSRQVLVWSEHHSTGTLYACLRPAGHSIAIGKRVADDGPYLGDVATSHVMIRGTTVSDLLTTGLNGQSACLKYYPADPMCMTARQTAQVFDLGARRSLRQPLATAAVAYVFAPTGAIAWEAPTSPGIASEPLMLQAVGFDPSSLREGPIQTLDSGDLGASLQFTGLTLEWNNAGQPKSLALTTTS